MFCLSNLLCHKARLKTPNEGDICGNQQKIQATPRLPNTEKQINFTKYGLPFHQKLMPIGKPKNLIYISLRYKSSTPSLQVLSTFIFHCESVCKGSATTDQIPTSFNLTHSWANWISPCMFNCTLHLTWTSHNWHDHWSGHIMSHICH